MRISRTVITERCLDLLKGNFPFPEARSEVPPAAPLAERAGPTGCRAPLPRDTLDT